MNVQEKQAMDAASASWWRGGVIYQIYTRSYQDSNGDGIGDLAGITRRLPYVASLGVDAIWISPFFKSPMKDFGYDVSDYRDVDPMFGTLADFDALLDAAHKLGLRVMMDLVLSHTSDQHLWFGESRQSRDNSKSDWYVWADPQPDGTPPNNWLSIFGGSGWQWDNRREQYYLHNFLTAQPDLNFHNMDVQDALLDVARFWLDRGVDGFRLDTINFYFHDKELRSNPPLEPEMRNSSIAPSVNPYNHQRHIYSKNRPETLGFLRRFRSLLDEYDGRACVGEVGDAQMGLELLGQYTAGDECAHMCYAFELLSGAAPTPAGIRTIFDRMDSVAADGWACWAYSNHDVPRHATRWDLPAAGLRLYTTLQMCLRGSVCIYQGEELGLPEADVAFEDLQDPYGIEFWPEFKGRDGCRTPMVWEAQDENSGFGVGRPWLPVIPVHAAMSVSTQEDRRDALIHHYRHAIAFRHNTPVLMTGDQIDLTARGALLTFVRQDDRNTVFCAFNMGADPMTLSVPEGQWQAIGATLDTAGITPDGIVALNGWQCCIARKI